MKNFSIKRLSLSDTPDIAVGSKRSGNPFIVLLLIK